MTIKKYIIGMAILIIVLVFGFSAKNIMATNNFGAGTYYTNNPSNDLGSNGNNVVNIPAGGVQNAKLALVDFSYKLTPNKLVKGVPVRVEVDAATLSGCMVNVVIRDFNVRKTIRPGDNIIEFTPDKTGTFWITCSMGMGPGSFEVVNSDGTSNPNAKIQATAPKLAGGSCTANGGGCGCGG